MQETKSRRRFVRELGVTAAVLSLAGCSGDGGDGSGETATPTAESTETATPTAESMETATPTAESTETATPTDSGGERGGASAIDEYLSDADNYDGTVVDATGQDEVTVEVGAEGNGGGFAFAPPAVRVESGTTVLWDWVGQGGLHNVVAEDGTFDSGEPASGSDNTFEYTFSETGTFLYFCSPHKSLGMKGAVVVE